MIKDMRILVGGLVLAVAVLGAGGWWLSQDRNGDKFAQCRKSMVSGGMEAFGVPFTLTDQTGARVTDKQVFSKPGLLYFGYTYCPDVCPLDTSRNAAAVDILKDQGMSVAPVMISIDPRRDTPEVLASFAENIHPDMIGLTGTTEEIEAVSKGWRNMYKIEQPTGDDPDDYLVNHMTHTFLVLPETGTVEFFDREVTPEDMAARVGCFVEAAS